MLRGKGEESPGNLPAFLLRMLWQIMIQEDLFPKSVSQRDCETFWSFGIALEE